MNIDIDKTGRGDRTLPRCGGLALSLSKSRFDLRHKERVAVPVGIADSLQCIEHFGCGGDEASVCFGGVVMPIKPANRPLSGFNYELPLRLRSVCPRAGRVLCFFHVVFARYKPPGAGLGLLRRAESARNCAEMPIKLREVWFE